MTTETAYQSVGKRVPRLDALEKVTGRALFTADIELPRMLVARVVRSPLAHALIKGIDVSAARRVAGVRAIVTGRDAPYLYNMALRDQPFLTIERVRYVGEPVVAIAAEDEDAAAEAAELVRVEYEPLPAVLDPFAAMRPEAPLIHPRLGEYARDPSFTPLPGTNICNHFKLRKGDVEAAFRAAHEVFEDSYYSHPIQHCPLEPHAAIAQYEPASGQLTVWCSNQSPWFAADDLAAALGWPVHRVRVVCPYLGGGFGSKHGLKVEPVAVALALHTDGRPVKLVCSREEEFSATVVRGAVHIRLRTAVTREGAIIARQAEVVWDTGAYADVGPLLCRNGSYSVTGPYRIPNQWIDGYCVYTNKLVTGAFRGYGIMEMAFAYESQMDSIARALGIDPVEMRRRNLIKDGDETATGEVLYNVGLKAALEACARAMEWERPRPPGRGKAIVTTAKSSVAPSGSAAFVRLNDDGTVTVMVSTTEMGQGSRTVMAQMAAEALGARLEDVQVLAADTLFTPPDRSTSSSRSTFHMGNAVVQAAGDAREQLIKKASALLEAHPDDLEVRESRVFVKGVPDRYLTFRELAAVRPGVDMGPILGRGSFVPAGARPLDLETGQSPRITAFWLYTSQGVEVEVDRETGKVRVLRVVSVHDAGRSINPDACEAQIEGGVAQACSAALLEELVLDEEGRLLNPAFGDYLLATSKDVPPISPVIVEVPHAEGPYGAKGLGEGPTTGIAAALANAIEDATGVRIRELPLTPERVLRALKEKERSREEAT
ncbi:4-hydroxybenzoyl-CoA reductase subunit alpha [bacterium HR25]|nr:4-hydroxybenzoyl-CoA reductase subunit alpha [bacterium HR25]